MDSVKLPVAHDEAAPAVLCPQREVRIGDLDLDSRAARLAPGEAGQQGGAGDGVLRRGHQLRGVPGADQFGVGGLAADVGHVLVLPVISHS